MPLPYRFLLLCLLFLLLGCGEDEDPLPPLDTKVAEKYFPLSLGQTRIYAVDSILLLQTVTGTVYDTALLNAREVLVDTFTAPDGRLWFRGERYEKDRSSPDSDYRIVSTYALSSDGYIAYRQEDNLAFTKLTSPLESTNSWEGNQFSEFRQFSVGAEFLDIYAGWLYTYSDSASTWEVNGNMYQDIAMVEQANVNNLIDYRRAYEVYAPEVGLIESFVDARHTQCVVCCNGDTAPCFDLSWGEKAEKGFILRQQLLRIE